jgi:Ser/Thr protein kinase RdoA (MazF antagonist)
MDAIFPATYSTLCPVALASLIEEKYVLKNVSCKLLVRGVGDTYLVMSADAHYILRIYRASHRSLPQIREEMILLVALKEAKVPVSYPVAMATGEMILLLDAVEGTRHAVLFSYAPGRAEKWLNDEQLRDLGKEMARFHNVSAGMNRGSARWAFDLATTIFDPLEKIKPAFEHDAENYAWLLEKAEQVKEKLAGVTGFSEGYCHFDFLPKNMHFENNKVTFFDFDFMGNGWLVNDIMTFWQHLVLDVYTNRMTRTDANQSFTLFLEAYRAYRAVSEEELRLIPYLAFGFWLFYMGFHTTHDQFYVFAQPAHVKMYTGILKHIEKTCWPASTYHL